MEVTEAPPAMMEVDSTILERVEKVCTIFFSLKVAGFKAIEVSFPGGEGGSQR